MDPRHMTLEERSYFQLEPAAHVVAWAERKRLARILARHHAARLRSYPLRSCA